MARGIEELSEMQVTGPVQGGDMVMKPNEAPVGAAALLNKMSRQNTPGIFKLPMPDKQMPDFMKVAAEGVEQQTAQGDSINQMAGELLRQGINIQGMGMDEIIQIYEQTFGSPGDVDEFGVSEIDPSDWRSILKMLEAGMSWEEIEAQTGSAELDQAAALKDIRDDAKKVEAFAPEEHELAYITRDEQDILKLLGGSGETNPITGIKQYPQYGGATGASDEDEKAQAYGYRDEPRGETRTSREASGRDQEWTKEGLANVGGILADQVKDEQLQEDIKKGGTQQEGLKPTIIETITDKITDVFTGDPLKTEDWLKTKEFADIKSEIDKWQKADTKLEGLSIGALFNALQGGPYKDKDKLWREVGEGEEDERTLEGLKKRIKELGGDTALESLKHLAPELYYKFVDTTTSGATEDLAKLAATQGFEKDLTKEQKMLNRKIFEARAEMDRLNKGRDRHPGTGVSTGPGEKITETIDETITTTPDERAGAWNLGGTMPYTHDVATAGVEMDVPLGRRFQIDKGGKYRGTTGMDLNEAMQYATLGGHQQLEPFQEYLARRRKHLGEDEPQYFDEEGNVIYSGTV